DLVVMDADDTHPPETIPAMAAKAAEGFDIVIASRYQRGSRIEGVPWHRRIGSRVISRYLSMRLKVAGVRDYTCGFRLYRGAFLRGLAGSSDALIRETGFASTAELLLSLAARGARCAEVPFTLRYDRKIGPSKMRPLHELGAIRRLRQRAKNRSG
ncbi:MAG: glycosyltransferase, partial [Planctomycetota bacterium]